METPQLTIITEEERRTLNLNQGETTIGRRGSNTIVLLDPAVSGQHARLTVDAGIVHLEDLNSTNGTYVDGVEIHEPCLLNDEAAIMMGSTTLLFTASRKQTITIESSASEQQPENRPDVKNVPQYRETRLATLQKAHLEFLKGDGSLERKMNLDKTVNPLGRLGVGVAAISFGKNGWVLSPVDGLVPWLNGSILNASSALLKDQDMITLGDLEARFILDLDAD